MHEGLTGEVESLLRVARRCAARGWVPATAGNFSVRLSGRPQTALVTRSGLDKGEVTAADLIEVEFEVEFSGSDSGDFRVLGAEADASGQADVAAGGAHGRPSAETRLHGVIYEAFPQVGAIVHGHSVWNTLLSLRSLAAGVVRLEGYELLKALDGVATHEHVERVPVVANSQEYPALAREVAGRLRDHAAAHGVLLAGHGLYTWGKSMEDAWRHIEALEFLFEVEYRRQCGL